MTRGYLIGGVKFNRRSNIQLSRDERTTLDQKGRLVLRRTVEWPLRGRTPKFEKAYVDAGGTPIWGPGPYLKVPNQSCSEEDDELINRVFCPWGYPPDRLRLARSSKRVELVNVGLIRDGARTWMWMLTVAQFKKRMA